GKTTRVAAAMLDAGMAELQDKTPAQIILLQPRRVAARAAASRISEERNNELGQETGYQVRFEKRTSKNTRILVCTEGVFLRRLQDDPLLENVAAVVFDEFHERSIDSDLALALVRQVRPELRPDLKIVVMSATLNSASIAAYLGNCPSIECPGRMFPVTIEYLKFPSSDPIQQQAARAAKQLLNHEQGDILVFLPGVGEIRQTQALLDTGAFAQDLVIMPLYGDLPLEEQRKVLVRSEKQKIILATNVAETSLTIDGVTAVIDSGLARINKLDAQLGLNSLQTVKISKASAEQRAGRAGRTQAGTCVRLWTEREQLSLRDFELPEIARVELSECLLQLLLWGESDLQAFQWFEHPPQAAYNQAVDLLEQLDAIENGKLSQLGKQMALLPLQPRLARLVLEGERLGCLDRASLCAALLSERNPLKRSLQTTAAKHNTSSDVLDRLSAIEDFEATGNKFSFAGELNTGAAKQIIKAADQVQSIFERADNPEYKSARKTKLDERDSDEAILRSIMAAFPDRICKRREANSRRARMVGGRGVRLADESAVMEGELFVAVELLDTGQAESLVRQASYVDKDWLPQSHVKTSIEVIYDQSRQKVMAMKRN
ncbi:MAG: DEAD/DEAH box helicase, partial [Candidatus Obscuribacterales bacterium]|nr:DEAD/DEAH box helicase [Candidatus Obscuribacterales bacterium]